MLSFLRQNAGAFQLIFVVVVVGSALLLSASMKPAVSEARPKALPNRVAVSVVDPVPSVFKPRIKLSGVVE